MWPMVALMQSSNVPFTIRPTKVRQEQSSLQLSGDYIQVFFLK
ncbi:hypothetical protein ABIE50_001405 [Chitinophaga sp. OAE865]